MLGWGWFLASINRGVSMFTIQCTKMLAEELRINVSKPTESTNNSIYAWHAHIFRINRHKCVQLMNNQSRYNFIMYGMKKADFMKLNQRIIDGIAENLAADGVEQNIIEQYLSNSNQIAYAVSSDRSIISQMNEMRLFIDARIICDGKEKNIETDLYQLNRQLNQFVMSRLPKVYSRETMIDALGEL